MRIYFDHNATSTVPIFIREKVLALYSYPLNASSLHNFGADARALLEEAREKILGKLKIFDKKLVFTSSGTEANAMMMNSCSNYKRFFSSVEHKSVLVHSQQCDEIIDVNIDGCLDLEQLEAKLENIKCNKVFVSVMMANNETGIIQPISKILSICKRHGAYFHTDASQYFGKLDWDREFNGCDAVTLSGHKIGAGLGAGILSFDHTKLPILPLIKGGGQEQGLRGGTENILAISGLKFAVEGLDERVGLYKTHVAALRDRLENGIARITLSPEKYIVGYKSPRLPNTSCIIMPHVSSMTQIIYFNLRGIAVGQGSACSSNTLEESYVLKAMKLKSDLIGCSIRVSLGPDNTEKEIDCFLEHWSSLYSKNH